jgi:hypothetical protein
MAARLVFMLVIRHRLASRASEVTCRIDAGTTKRPHAERQQQPSSS